MEQISVEEIKPIKQAEPEKLVSKIELCDAWSGNMFSTERRPMFDALLFDSVNNIRVMSAQISGRSYHPPKYGET